LLDGFHTVCSLGCIEMEAFQKSLEHVAVERCVVHNENISPF
jgi:hypothetical protein